MKGNLNTYKNKGEDMHKRVTHIKFTDYGYKYQNPERISFEQATTNVRALIF
jgi:hypothetical protein